MNQGKNILLKEVPDKVANVAKGILFIVASIPFGFLIFILTISVVPGVLYIYIGIFLAAVAFISMSIHGIRVMIGK